MSNNDLIKKIIKEFNIAKTPAAIHYPADQIFEKRGLIQFNISGRTFVALDEVIKKLQEFRSSTAEDCSCIDCRNGEICEACEDFGHQNNEEIHA